VPAIGVSISIAVYTKFNWIHIPNLGDLRLTCITLHVQCSDNLHNIIFYVQCSDDLFVLFYMYKIEFIVPMYNVHVCDS
jgi:hypothetical protein